MSQPPAAWHPDPENPAQLRWWDGNQWTSATAPAPSTNAIPSEAVGATGRPAPAKRRNGWRAAGLIIGALVVGGLLARVSPVAITLTAVAAIGIALFVLLVRPVPTLGLRSRMSGLVALGVAALLVTGGAIASASTGPAQRPTASQPQTLAELPTSAPEPARTPSPSPTTFDTLAEEVAVPYAATTVDDPQRDQGTTTLVTAGVDGVKVVSYRVTLVDGVEVSREVVGEVMKTPAIDQVTAIGSRAPVAAPVPLVQQGSGTCDANYADACVPVASDVDCAGGSGDGPAYVDGPVRIVGSDPYDLDRDGDGIACD